jgi:mRNA degradation ribonuclease J1/J2
MTLTSRVTAAIEKYFSEADRVAVTEALAAYQGGERERLHLTILRLSRRNVERVRKLVKMAQRDYRDVIVMESHPTRKYIVGILRRGPNASADDKTTLKVDSLKRWKDDGAIVIGGLCLDGSDFKGLYIFTVDSVQTAQDLVATDPGVASGMLVFEFHEWLTVDGLQVGVPKDFLDV